MRLARRWAGDARELLAMGQPRRARRLARFSFWLDESCLEARVLWARAHRYLTSPREAVPVLESVLRLVLDMEEGLWQVRGRLVGELAYDLADLHGSLSRLAEGDCGEVHAECALWYWRLLVHEDRECAENPEQVPGLLHLQAPIQAIQEELMRA